MVEEIRVRWTLCDEKVAKALKKGDTDYKEVNGVIMYKGLIYVPQDKLLQERVIAMNHDTILAGHPGWHKTLEHITRDYWWPTMSGQVL